MGVALFDLGTGYFGTSHTYINTIIFEGHPFSRGFFFLGGGVQRPA